jgi:hypothetical protein
MNAITIIILVVAVALMLVPAALVWYINIGGIMLALKEAREKRAVAASKA